MSPLTTPGSPSRDPEGNSRLPGTLARSLGAGAFAAGRPTAGVNRVPGAPDTGEVPCYWRKAASGRLRRRGRIAAISHWDWRRGPELNRRIKVLQTVQYGLLALDSIYHLCRLTGFQPILSQVGLTIRLPESLRFRLYRADPTAVRMATDDIEACSGLLVNRAHRDRATSPDPLAAQFEFKSEAQDLS
jgi:hypothetical protein